MRVCVNTAWEWMWMLIGGKGVEVRSHGAAHLPRMALTLSHLVDGMQWLSIVVTAMFYFAVYQAYKSRLRMLRSGAISSVPSNDQRDGMASRVPPRRQQSQGASAATEFTVKLVAVPIVFFGARLFGNINVVRTLATGNTDGQDWLDVLQVRDSPAGVGRCCVTHPCRSNEVTLHRHPSLVPRPSSTRARGRATRSCSCCLARRCERCTQTCSPTGFCAVQGDAALGGATVACTARVRGGRAVARASTRWLG